MALGSKPGSNHQSASSPRGWRRHLLRAALVTGGVLAVTAGGLGWLGYAFVRRELPQFLEDNLSDALGRPIKVGEFKRFGPLGVVLGPAIVPPTEDDFTWLKAKALDVSFNPLELLLTRTLRPSIIFEEPEVALKQGFDGEWQFAPLGSVGEEGFFKTELKSLQIRNASLAIGPISRTSIVEVPKGVTSATLILLENVNQRVQFSGKDNQTVSFVVGGRLNNGAFQIRGEGRLDTLDTNLAVRAQQLPIEAVNPLFGGEFFVRDGLLSSNLDLKVRPGADDPLTATGTARLRNGDLVFTALPSPFQDINGTLTLDGVGGRLQNSSLKFGSILIKATGGVDLHQGHDLQIEIPQVSVEDIESTLAQDLPIDAAGSFQVNTAITGELLAPQAAGQLTNLGPVQIDRLGINAIAADFAADLAGFTLNQARINPATGGTITAQGTAGFLQDDLLRPDLDFTAQTDLPLDALATLYGVSLPPGFQLGALVAEARITGKPDAPRGIASWQLPRATFPGRGQVTYANLLVQAQDALFQVGQGTLRANAEADLSSLDWQATVAGTALSLGLVSPRLRGTLETDLQASGNLLALSPAGIQADGQIRLSDPIPLNLEGADQVMPGPLNARFAWTGQRLEIPEAVAPNLYISGGTEVIFPVAGGLPDLTGMDFIARLSDFNLGAAYGLLEGPDWLQLQGWVDFDGTLQGRLRSPRLAGTAGLRQFAVNNFALASDVSGPLRASLEEGALIDLQGEQTAIAAEIDPSLLPNSFRFVNGELLAQGQRQGDILNAKVRNFDIDSLAFRPIEQPDLGIVGGRLNANARINLADLLDPEVAASFAIAAPGLGTITAETLSGEVFYRDGQALLTGGTLQLTPATQFLLTASGRLFPQWQGSAEITTAQAHLQDLLQVLSIYSYADLGNLFAPPSPGSAADLAITPVGQPDAPILIQATLARALRELAQIQSTQQAAALLPQLEQLDGQISGRLGLAVSQADGIAADFDFQGQDWIWGRYDFGNAFVAQGRYRDQTLTLTPVEFRAGETRLGLMGEVSLTDSDLQVRAENLPLTAASKLLESPIDVTGLVNVKAHLTGAYTNPLLEGNFAVDQATVNQQPLTEISSTFQYQDAAFSIDGRVVGPAPEPLLFSGTVPYALPFMTVQPATEDIALRVSLKDDALALVDLLFAPLLTWGGGQANIDVSLGGTLQSPLVTGLAAFDGASFNSVFLDASLQDLTGAVRFQGTQIQIPSLKGSLFDGDFELTGQVPLLNPEATDGGLNLALNDVNFRYFNEVNSLVNGQVTLTGALLDPVIGGEVLLQDTFVQVGPELLALAQFLYQPPAEVELLLAQLEELGPAQLDHFRVLLAPAKVKTPPLFSFDLAGDLTISGPTNDLYAEGAVYLNDGWINTITAEFFLESGRDNIALFTPDYGLDPYLDLIMTARVPLQRNYNIQPLNSTTGSAEIPDIDPLGSTTIFDEIQIEARVKGPATRLFDNLQLTSNPPYSPEQLLGMASGGYLSDLGGAEPTLALGSNLLSALTATSQDSIGDALGLNRFRLTASTVLPDEAGDTLGYGVGVNLGITQNLSATLVQVLNQNQPIQFNARYRIDDNWGVRGSTNFSDENRVFLEYRLELD
jgi:translocation and assembly module TamB